MSWWRAQTVCFFFQQQNDGALYGNNVERLVRGVQDENSA
jgi:hypothetical protein